MLDKIHLSSTEVPSWPLPPGSPADELAQVLGEHDLLDAESVELIAALRLRHQAGQPLQPQAHELALRLSVLQREHQDELAAQLAELRALQERSTARLQALQQRVNEDAQRLQACCGQLDALRAVHARMAQELLAGLHVQALHAELRRMREESGKAWQRPALLGRAFAALSQRLQLRLAQAQRRCDEIHAVMAAGYGDIHAAFALSLPAQAAPPLQPYIDELTVLSGAYTRHLGLANLLRLLQPHYQTRLLRMLQTRLLRLFNAATAELESWSHALWTPAQARLEHTRDRLQHRHDGVQRVQLATEDLQQRISEIEAQELLEQESFGHALRLLARLEGAPDPASGHSPHLQARAA
jgi:hypothetical protein